MRPTLRSCALAAVMLAMAAPSAARAQTHACTVEALRLCGGVLVAPAHHRHLARTYRVRHLSRYGQPYHIPRFSQAEAEAEVHTVYPYRTGFGPPWPDFFGTPYYPPY